MKNPSAKLYVVATHLQYSDVCISIPANSITSSRHGTRDQRPDFVRLGVGLQMRCTLGLCLVTLRAKRDLNSDVRDTLKI